MTRFYLVRNARTEEGVGFIENPPLDDIGQIQAEGVADLLGGQPRMALISSPQRRAIETATPLARRWMIAPTIDENLTLMPLPDPSAYNREAWLKDFMKGTWDDALPFQTAWRRECLGHLTRLDKDAVIVSHFVVINMIVAEAMGDVRTTVFQPDNASISIVDAEGGVLKLIELGRQAATRTL